MMNLANPEQFGVALMEVLGLKREQGIVSITLKVEAHKLPRITVEREISTLVAGQMMALLENYDLVPKESE